jgi:hypothetical protein
MLLPKVELIVNIFIVCLCENQIITLINIFMSHNKYNVNYMMMYGVFEGW